jgi:hypothetical protein
MINHWSGLKERRMDRDWDVPKERLNAEKAEELRKKGFSGMSKHMPSLGTNTERLVRRQL